MGKINKNSRKKIAAVASSGGHWIQLQRLYPVLCEHDTFYITTIFDKEIKSNKNTYYVAEASRWNKFKLIKQAYQVFRIIRWRKPDFIITTGASPGLWAILSGKLFRSKTIWIDSIANTARISLSGRLIRPFTDLHLTQWPELEDSKSLYKGSVIS